MNDRERLEAIVKVVRQYLPPDGICIKEAMGKIIELIDPMDEDKYWGKLSEEHLQALRKSMRVAAEKYVPDLPMPNSNLRKAAEQALEALEHFNRGNSLAVVQGEFDDEIETLRHALHSTKFLPEEMDAYERGFIEGRQDQMRSTVERAVNAMAKREWVGLTDEEMRELTQKAVDDGMIRTVTDFEYIRSIETKLKEKNHG